MSEKPIFSILIFMLLIQSMGSGTGCLSGLAGPAGLVHVWRHRLCRLELGHGVVIVFVDSDSDTVSGPPCMMSAHLLIQSMGCVCGPAGQAAWSRPRRHDSVVRSYVSRGHVSFTHLNPGGFGYFDKCLALVSYYYGGGGCHNLHERKNWLQGILVLRYNVDVSTWLLLVL